MKPVVFEAHARVELGEAAGWYEEKRKGLGERFFAAVEATTRRLPSRAKHRDLAGFKHIGVKTTAVMRPWPYRLFFLDDPAHFVVIAVAHDRREPGYWLDRLDR